jgi:hypothetical protein
MKKKKLERLRAMSAISHTDKSALRNLFPKAARSHPGRMRISLAIELVEAYLGQGAKANVADPMAGTGVTGVACALNFIDSFCGCEKFPQWAKIAMSSITKAVTERKLPLGTRRNSFALRMLSGDAADAEIKDQRFDLLLTSPPFPNSHRQGRSAMQSSIRANKQLFAGTDFKNCETDWGIGTDPDKTRWIQELARVLKPWVLRCKKGATLLIHVKNFVRDGKKVRVDLWTKKALKRLSGIEVVGYHPVPLAYRSAFQEWGRYPKRLILSRREDGEGWLEDLECGHTKRRKKRHGKEMPKRAVCLACGPKDKHVEVREERVVVGRRTC